MKKNRTIFSAGIAVFLTCVLYGSNMNVYAESDNLLPYVINKDNLISIVNEDETDIPEIEPAAGSCYLAIAKSALKEKENPSARFSVWIDLYNLEQAYKEDAENFQSEQEIDGVSYTDLLKSSSLDYETDMKIIWDTKFYLMDKEAARLEENGIQVTNVIKDRFNRSFIYAIVSAEDLDNMPMHDDIGYLIGLAAAPGDAQIDGKIDILDVITINKSILGKETLSAMQINSSDINKNGKADANDSISIMKYIVGVTETLNEH